MKFVSSFVASILFSSLTWACHGGATTKPGVVPQPGDRTPSICVAEDSKACAYVWFQSHLSTKTEAKFIIKLENAGPQNPADVRADLWMQMGSHGHGSAPLKVSVLSDDMIQIENAWFVMKGEWQVRVQFTVQGQLAEVQIPVYVE